MKSAVPMVLAILILHTPALAEQWDTHYERSGYTRTPSYDETIRYCRMLADASPWVHYTTFGTSPQGRDLPLVVVNRKGHFESELVRGGDTAVFLIQAGIHSGEIDGKDAGLMLIRDIAIRRSLEKLLEHVTILFIPIFNVDGHERSGRYQRANQNGPEEMGWRVTATNLNLNRDYLKADTPEMQAWVELYTQWMPEFFADCHVTDGADYQYVVTWAIDIWGNMDPGLTRWVRKSYLPPLGAHMDAAGIPFGIFNWYRDEHDPRSGIVTWTSSPRYATGYTTVHNRPGLLIETHMLKDYKTRVTGTYEILRATLEILDKDHAELRSRCKEADQRTASASFRKTPFALDYDASPDSVFTEFLGFEYDVVESDVTGGDWFRFSERPMSIRIPFFDIQRPTAIVTLPEAYILGPQWWDVIARLELHGVRTERLKEEVRLFVETIRFENASWEVEPYEGRHPVTFESQTALEERTFPKGSVLIDMNQRAARVAAHILEPDGPDSFVYWGFFDAIFEQKEYIESYVIEKIAREMLAADPALREAFEEKKRSDTEFAGDPEKIREWFYRRTPYWDEAFNRYPVGRITDAEVLRRLPR